ncbi:hypothetical protein [Rhizomonospora bruguierae]|uniref:hypothetical protein n=1 Tax=Rhizomonospora bruguierae TaxID=1581705 RepID=UPI001BD17E53|nr:hypothetical protein [Micromonospora sp. NBRC 107566]
MTIPADTATEPATDPRDGHCYRFIVKDPWVGYASTCVGYIGESIRIPFVRMMEHVLDQWWADTIVAWEVIDTYPSKGSAMAAEEALVRAEMPLYNWEYNGGNPRRIAPSEQKRQAIKRGYVRKAQPMRPHKPRRSAVESAGSPPRAATSPRARQPRVRLITERAWFWWAALWFALAVTVGSWLHARNLPLGDSAWAGMGVAFRALAELEAAVRKARERIAVHLVLDSGWKYADLGRALGVTRQAASKTYGPAVEEQMRRNLRRHLAPEATQ